MDPTINTQPPPVEVLWRPGCPFCSSLRRGLRRAGVATVEHDIWASPEAAARVRAVTGGDETVPTVVIGTQTLVNPSVREVEHALATEYPGRSAAASDESAVDDADVLRGPGVSAGAGWTVVVALAWVALAAWRPSTTWHLAPFLLAAAWPWVVGQDQSSRDPHARRRVSLVAVGGLVAASATTGVLAALGLLDGPTWVGRGSAAVEAVMLALVGAFLALLVGIVRTLRRTAPASASVGATTFATSADVVTVEGNAYFPRDSVPDGVLHPSRTMTFCPWKGKAGYFDVHVDDTVVPDGAWTYRHPLPLARRIKGRVAFWNGVDVTRD